MRRLLARDGRFATAVAGALFIPALYALIYLSSMWDPSTRTGALRAGLVNEDTGVVADPSALGVADLADEVVSGKAVEESSDTVVGGDSFGLGRQSNCLDEVVGGESAGPCRGDPDRL